MRLIVSYWIVAATTLGLAAIDPAAFRFPRFDYGAWPEATLFAVANVGMFAADLVELFGRNWADGLVVGQIWSIGAELWFYLLVPLFWRLSDRQLLFVLMISIAIRIAIIISPLPFWPWQQRFFPVELMFFVLGMLAYRWREIICRWTPRGPITLLGASTFIAFAGSLFPVEWWGASAVVAMVVFFAFPSVLKDFGKNHRDRIIGEFSYPIYLWHVPLSFFAWDAVAKISTPILAPWCFLALCIAISAPLVWFVELPLERWRARRCQASEFPKFADQQNSPVRY